MVLIGVRPNLGHSELDSADKSGGEALPWSAQKARCAHAQAHLGCLSIAAIRTS